MNGLISIIIPIYNMEMYLARCIDSVCKQTYSNLEIILINDGSTDGTKGICEEYKRKDKRIKLINQINKGLGAARNEGMKLASGDYFVFLDSDDYLEIDCIECLYKALIELNADLSIVDYFDVTEDGNKLKKSTKNHKMRSVLDGESAAEEMLYWKRFGVSAWAKLFKRTLWEDERFAEGIDYEDLPTTYKVAAKAKRVVWLPEKKMYYVHRMGSIVHQSFNERKLSILESSKEIKAYVSVNMPGIYKAAISREFSSAFSLLLQISGNDELERQLKNIIKENRKTVLFDSKAREKARLAAFLSYFGFGICKVLFKIGKGVNPNL